MFRSRLRLKLIIIWVEQPMLSKRLLCQSTPSLSLHQSHQQSCLKREASIDFRSSASTKMENYRVTISRFRTPAPTALVCLLELMTISL